MEFTDVVRSEDELRALMGDPVAPAVVDKTLSALDRHCLCLHRPRAVRAGRHQ